MKLRIKAIALFMLCLGWLTVIAPKANAWTDQTHMAIAMAGGLSSFHNACALDVSHTVAYMNNIWITDSPAHYFDAKEPAIQQDVIEQLNMLGLSRKKAPNGYLLGALVNAVRKAKARTEKGKFDDYYYAVLTHYIGDLSQPMHMTVYDDFNRQNHLQIDDLLTYKDVAWDVDGAVKIASELQIDDSLRFNSESELVDYILKVANESYELAQRLRLENRVLTRKEALQRASASATILRAVLRYCGKDIVQMDKIAVLSKLS